VQLGLVLILPVVWSYKMVPNVCKSVMVPVVTAIVDSVYGLVNLFWKLFGITILLTSSALGL